MSLIWIVLCIAVVGASIAIWIKLRRKRDRDEMERHSITPDALHALLSSDKELVVCDVRQPLDLLADSEIIPGAKRVAPKDVLDNPSLIPHDKDTVVYCTCPSDKTSRSILHKALALHFQRIKFLKGGLAAWKAKGYPVQPYEASFHLDTKS